MDQDTLQVMLREAAREGVASMLRTLMELDRAASRSEQSLAAFLRERGGRKKGHYPRRFPEPWGR